MGRPRKFSREGVLQKALPVFWKYGFARASLQDLEQATGVNKSGLYAEFDSKEALFLACLRYYFDNLAVLNLLRAEPLGWSNIQRLLEPAPRAAGEAAGCFSVASMRELPGLPEAAREAILDGRRTLTALIKANIAAEHPKADVDALCDLVLSFFSGVCIESNLGGDDKQARAKAATFVGMLRAA